MHGNSNQFTWEHTDKIYLFASWTDIAIDVEVR